VRSFAALFIVSILIAVGCAPTRTYDVTVHNNTPDPVMLWLTKDGPPAEEGWYTTEQFLQAPPDTPSPGIQLPAGDTADTGKVKGKFPQGTHAILSITRSGEAARVPGGSDPLIIRLAPGKNEITVVEEGGKLMAKPAP
jgi:hypothetical protein